MGEIFSTSTDASGTLISTGVSVAPDLVYVVILLLVIAAVLLLDAFRRIFIK